MSGYVVEDCQLCGGTDLESVLHLGSSPPTCNMVPVGWSAEETHYPLELLRCSDCMLVQLSMVPPPAEVFPPDYPYSSGNSKALHDNFEDLAQSVTWAAGLTGHDLVVDIGANDGTLLSKFDGCRRIGVEPTRQGERFPAAAGWFEGFFTEAVACRLREFNGPAKVITACNVLAHVEDIHEVMRGVDVLLADDGVFIAENHDLASVVNGQWDTIYHEHLRFYDEHSFHVLLHKYGLGPERWQKIGTHGGSFRVIAMKGFGVPVLDPTPEYDFAKLNREIASARHAIRMATRSGRLWGIGATARATTIINHCGLDVDDIPCVCEVSGSDKIGHYIPGTRIPVVDEAELFEAQPPGALLFSWHLADSIVPKLRERGYERPVTVPLPKLRYL